MKNLYALNSNEDIIHIESVDKKNKEKYFCCNCGDELIARKGYVNAHHFAHKSKLDCNYESYLHKLSKLKFFTKYNQCLVNGIPFYIEFVVNRECNSCIDVKHLELSCNLNSVTEKFDLTTKFDKILVEKKHGNFIADILLISSELNEVIFIEFFVSHKCDPVKLDSGYRIVEIEVKKEEDLDFIESRKIKGKYDNINFFNFKFKKRTRPFINLLDCRMPFEVLYTKRKGGVYRNTKRVHEIIEDFKNDEYKYFEIIEKGVRFFYDKYDLEHYVLKLENKGIRTKNCRVCRFYAKNNRRDREYDDFCKLHKAEIEHLNFATDCTKFWHL